MAPKRGAASPTCKAAKSARTAKVAKAPAMEESKFQIELLPADTLLDELRSALPAHCVGMLAAILPMALETAIKERHGFQQRLLNVLSVACTKEQASRESVIKELEAKLTAMGGEQEQATAKLTTAQSEEETRRSTKIAAEVAAEAAVRDVAGAAAALKEAKAGEEQAEAAIVQAAESKTEFDGKVEAQLPPLKEGSFAKKDWRLRQKVITQLMALFSSTAAPQSLQNALPVALKDGPESRSAFAARAIEMGESLLKARSIELEDAAEAARCAAANVREAVALAEARTMETIVTRDAAQQDCINKENEWLEAEVALSAARKVVDACPEELQHVKESLVDAKASLQRLCAAVENFHVAERFSPKEPLAGAGELEAVAMEEAAVVNVEQQVPQVLGN